MHQVVQCSLSNVDSLIAVSNTSKETLCLRTHRHPNDIYVIPNAVDATRFFPNLSLRSTTDVINIVVLNRLVYRKVRLLHLMMKRVGCGSSHSCHPPYLQGLP